MEEKMMEKLEAQELLNLTEDNLLDALEELLFQKNVPKYGTATEAIQSDLTEYMKKHGFDISTQIEIDDHICDAASAAGAYGYRKGFKDGIILFRTLMKF